MQTYLKNGYIVTMGAEETVYDGGGVLIEGEDIIAVGKVDPQLVKPDAEVIDLQGKYVLPGFVNTHVHTSQQISRGVGDDVDFIYHHKTADLFIAAAVTGALAAGGGEDCISRLREYALNLGLAFQFEDDLLDGDSPYSREETERKVSEYTAAAVSSLKGLPGDVSFLSALAERLEGRKV